MTASSSQPTPQARTAVTRDRIELAALGAFADVGFDAASTREIARRAGVRQQLITYHYGSKLELWKSAVRGQSVKRGGGLLRRAPTPVRLAAQASGR